MVGDRERHGANDQSQHQRARRPSEPGHPAGAKDTDLLGTARFLCAPYQSYDILPAQAFDYFGNSHEAK